MKEFKKSQQVRLWDVFFIGPFMLWIAYKGKLTTLDAIILGSLGALTVGYNLYNYNRNKEQFHGRLLH